MKIITITFIGLFLIGCAGSKSDEVRINRGDVPEWADGKTAEDAMMVYEHCLRIQDAGGVAIEMECVPYKVAEAISKKVKPIVMSMGSGPGCDVEYLFGCDVLLSTTGHVPRHSKSYRNFLKEFERLQKEREDAFQEFYDDVHSGALYSGIDPSEILNSIDFTKRIGDRDLAKQLNKYRKASSYLTMQIPKAQVIEKAPTDMYGRVVETVPNIPRDESELEAQSYDVGLSLADRTAIQAGNTQARLDDITSETDITKNFLLTSYP